MSDIASAKLVKLTKRVTKLVAEFDGASALDDRTRLFRTVRDLCDEGIRLGMALLIAPSPSPHQQDLRRPGYCYWCDQLWPCSDDPSDRKEKRS